METPEKDLELQTRGIKKRNVVNHEEEDENATPQSINIPVDHGSINIDLREFSSMNIGESTVDEIFDQNREKEREKRERARRRREFE